MRKAILLAVLAVVLAGAFALWHFTRETSEFLADQENHLASETQRQRASLAAWVGIPADLLAQHGAKAFVSTQTLNGALRAFEGIQVDLDGGRGGFFRIKSAALGVRDGFLPVVELKGEASRGAATLEATVIAVAAELPEKGRNGAFLFRLRVVSISPIAKIYRYQWELAGLARDFLLAGTQRITNVLPPVELFLRQELPLQLAGGPPVTQRVQVRGPGDWIEGPLSLPPSLALLVTLEPTRMVLTASGLHLWFAPRVGSAAAPAPAPTPPASSRDTLESRLARLAEEGDVALHLHRGVFQRFVEALRALPPEQKTVRFQATARSGELHEQGGGGAFGQGFRVYLENTDETRMSVTGQPTSLAPVPPPPGSAGACLDLRVEATITGQSRLHLHSNPPRVFGASVGGGAGTNVLTQIPAVTRTLDGRFQVTAGDDGGFRIATRLTGPAGPMVLPVQVGLGAFGTHTFNAILPLPLDQDFQGTLPLLVQKGEIPLPGGQVRTYTVTPSNPRAESTAESITLRLNARVEFSAPATRPSP